MVSLDGEIVKFKEPITLSKENSIEKWMIDIEKMMRASLR